MSELDELVASDPAAGRPRARRWDGDYRRLPRARRALRRGQPRRAAAAVPGHENRYLDLLRQVEPQRAALPADGPYPPERLLPWGIDEAGNVVWWLTGGDWPVVANEARGVEWYRYDGGAVAFLVAILSGRESSDFLTVEL